MVFKWATVTAVSPLRIKLDGDTSAIPATPDSLIDPATLAVDDRVRTELSGNRLVVLGRVGGDVRAWTAYTPTWGASTAPVLGNGSLSGRYTQIGKTVNFLIVLIMGSTTTYGSSIYTLTLPVAAASSTNSLIRGSGIGWNLSSRVGLLPYGISTTVFRMIRTSTDSEVTSVGLGVAWASGHSLTITGTYEAA